MSIKMCLVFDRGRDEILLCQNPRGLGFSEIKKGVQSMSKIAVERIRPLFHVLFAGQLHSIVLSGAAAILLEEY